MRVMVLIKANERYEAGAMPSKKLIAAMAKFNQEIVQAGVMLDGDGLKPTSKGVRVDCTGGKRVVINGPFTETKELVSGYWLWQVESLDEAIEWIKRSPFQEGTVELRPVFEPEDYRVGIHSGEEGTENNDDE